jgi:hypothetical protein
MRSNDLWSRASWSRILHSYRIAGGSGMAIAMFPPAGSARADVVYDQTNLVSDGFAPAANTDPDLIDPWGVSTAGIVEELHCQFVRISAVPESAPIAVLRRGTW